MQLGFPLEDRSGELYIDGVSTLELASKFDTPLYVMSEKRIRENYRRLSNAIARNTSKFRVHYAAKANTNLSVLKILQTEGAYVDVVSPGEAFLALKAGFQPEKLMFTGTSVRNDELRFMVDKGILINIDSQSQLQRLLKLAVPETLSVRVNPELEAGHHSHVITAGRNSKFGVYEEDAVKIYTAAKEAGVRHFGIHMHIGSGILEIEPFMLALEKLLKTARAIRERVGINFEFVDVGGGYGVPYRPEEKLLDVNLLFDQVVRVFRDKALQYGLGEPFLCVEPGRYIVCDAGALLTRVNTVKPTPFKTFIGVDAGFNTLVRPAMYGAYHQVLVANNLDAAIEGEYDVAGPLCESGDLLARSIPLPKVREGDVLAILNTGAYGYVMSSNYNSRPKAAEVLVNNGRYALIRQRENFLDLAEHQQIAEWLR
jgi:diaminopimelate decarboxylase